MHDVVTLYIGSLSLQVFQLQNTSLHNFSKIGFIKIITDLIQKIIKYQEAASSEWQMQVSNTLILACQLNLFSK